MMTDKEKQAQLKAKLLKIKLAETDYEIRSKVNRSKSPLKKQVPFGEENRKPDEIRNDALDKSEASTSGKKIRPKKPDQKAFNNIITAKAKVNKLKKKSSIPDEIMQEASDAAGLNKNQAPSYIAQEHGHKIAFKGHKIGGFKGASLSGQSGKYAKYWLLNAKETNGNGWGIAAHTAKDNMKKFIGRPLVVTASSWHGASEYGDEYEHPYLPTNDITAILNHQEKFRVGSIVDVFEDSHGDWFASVEMLPKFASSRLPPFCSPAIYQLDASEAEGQISKWEALHLAALTENPAYGARIALLKGTCVGTDNECKVQFKAAKQEPGIECPIKEKQKKVKSKLSKLKKKQMTANNKSIPPSIITNDNNQSDLIDSVMDRKMKKQYKKKGGMTEKELLDMFTQPTRSDTKDPIGAMHLNKDVAKRLAKLKIKIAGLGDENMTYQDSKKVKIIKKKHPEVRKASLASEFTHNDIEGVLRKIHRSPLPPDKREHQSSFLSSTGDYIGGGEDHTDTIKSIFKDKEFTPEDKANDGPVTRFSTEHRLPRVQRRVTRRGGRVSFGIHAPVNKTQLRSMKDVEAGGEELAFVVGKDTNGTVGEGYRDLTKALRENKFLG